MHLKFFKAGMFWKSLQDCCINPDPDQLSVSGRSMYPIPFAVMEPTVKVATGQLWEAE